MAEQKPLSSQCKRPAVAPCVRDGAEVTQTDSAPGTAGEPEGHEMGAWHRTIIDLSPNVIIAHVDWTIVLANQAAANLFGFAAPDDLVGQNVLNFAVPGMREIHKARYQQLISGRAADPIETQIVNRDGTTHYLKVHTMLSQFRGQPTVLIVGHNLTEERAAYAAAQRASEELEKRVRERTAELAVANANLLAQISARERIQSELRRANTELQALYTVATRTPKTNDMETLLYTVLDQMWVLNKPNATWAYLVSADGEFTARRGIRDSRPDSETASINAIIEKTTREVLQTGMLKLQPCDQTAPTLEEPAPRSAGFRIAAHPITEGRRTVGVLGALSLNRCEADRPITHQDLRFLQSLAHQLSMVIENTHSAETEAEVKVLRQIDALRSELIANFTHDLKSPLGVIKFSSTTLMREDVDFPRDLQMELLSDIATQTDQLSHIVEQILQLGKLENDKLQLRLEPTDLLGLCNRVARSMRRRNHHHQLSVDFEPSQLVANVDALRIQEVLTNLLDNAIKYSPDGGTVIVRGRISQNDAVISVADQGIGITPEDLHHIFERFYRGHHNVSVTTDGAGLGLAVCRSIVEAHAGKIWVDSRTGEGTTVSFTLPLFMSEVEEKL